MDKLAAAYSTEVSEERQAIYIAALSDMSIEDLDAAFLHSVRTCKFFPTIAEIRAAVNPDRLNAEKAWLVFKKRFQSWHPDIGFSNAPEADEAGRYAERSIGGVARFAQSEIVHEHFIRAEFIEAYNRYRETAGHLAPTKEQAEQMLAKLQRKELDS